MKKLFYLLVILSVALGLAACGTEQASDISSDTSTVMRSSTGVTAESIISKMDGADYKEGELLVKFKSGGMATAPMKAHQALGASVKKKFAIVPNLEHVVLPEGVSVKDAIEQYMADPNVEYAEPNYIRKASQVIPNDYYYGQQWALENRGLFNGTVGADIKAPLAWTITLGMGNVNVAVLDTGIDYDHVDLVGNIWTNTAEICPNGIDDDLNGYVDDCIGWDFTICEEYDVTIDYDNRIIDAVCAIAKTEDNDPWDDNDHGTHVAGIIGAVGNNGRGIAGVIWNVKLMAVKFLNYQGYGTVAEELGAIYYAVDNGAHIINASYGSNDFSQAESDAVAYANSNGVIVVAAAGNSGTNNDVDPEYPASYPFHNVIAVAATDQNDRRAPFSNWGKNSVHVGAPGVYILSTVPGNQYVGTNQELFMGTSQAAPHVSGLTALLLTYYDHYTIYQIRGTVIRYSDPVPTLTDWIYGVEPTFTAGRINAYRAVTSLLHISGLSATAISTSQISLAWLDHATGEEGYKVERRPAGGAWIQVTNPPLGQNATAYTDGGLIDGTTYFHRVRAYSYVPNPPDTDWLETNADYKLEASATTPLNPPTGLTATEVSGTQINLAWVDNSQAEDGYKIERSSSDFVQIATVGPNATTYVDSGCPPETSCIYRVRAFNAAAGNSPYSNEASVGPPPPTSSSSSCSIGAKQNTPTAIANMMVLLIPVLYIVYLRRRK